MEEGPQVARLSAQRPDQDFGGDRLRSIPDARKLARGRASLHRMLWRRSVDVRQRLSRRSLMDELRCDLRWFQGHRPRFLRGRAVGALPRQCAARLSNGGPLKRGPRAKAYFSVYFLAHSTPSQVSIFVGAILIR